MTEEEMNEWAEKVLEANGLKDWVKHYIVSVSVVYENAPSISTSWKMKGGTLHIQEQRDVKQIPAPVGTDGPREFKVGPTQLTITGVVEDQGRNETAYSNRAWGRRAPSTEEHSLQTDRNALHLAERVGVRQELEHAGAQQ